MEVLVARLDIPADGATFVEDRVAVEGWVFSTDPQISFVGIVGQQLEDSASTLAAGTLLGGSVLSETSTPIRLLDWRCALEDGAKIDPSTGRSGYAYRIHGTLARSSITASMLVRIAVVVRTATAISVSNTATLTLAASRFELPLGGIEPWGSSVLHSSAMLVRGWAASPTSRVAKVEIIFDQQPVAEACIRLSSANEAKALPEFFEIESCRFSAVLLYEEIVRQCSAERLAAGCSLFARATFEDGSACEIPGGQRVWYPANDASSRAATVVAECDSLRQLPPDMLELGGRWIQAGPGECSFVFSWAGHQVRFVEHGEPEGLEMAVDETLRHEFPDAFRAERFRLKLPRGMFGSSPGPIRMFSGDERIPVGPQYLLQGVRTIVERDTPAVRKHLGGVRGALAEFAGIQEDQRIGAPRSERRVVVASHNLRATEGAPKVLAQVLTHLAQQGLELVVVSPVDGELRIVLEDVGIHVHVEPLLSIVDQTPERYQKALRSVASIFGRPNVVYANVVDSFWAVDLGTRLGASTLFAIHESVSPLALYSQLPQLLQHRFIQTLRVATKLLFVAEATARLFSELNPRTVTIPNGVDIDAVDRSRQTLTPSQARLRLGIAENAKVIVCVGTTTARKAQDTLLEAVAELSRRSVPVVCLVVGARQSGYLDQLRALAASLGIVDSIRFIPEQGSVSEFYIAADVAVICSRQESAPLVSLEALAYGVPLVSTNVFGLAEQLSDRENALLCDVDAPIQLAEAISLLLHDTALSARLAAAGRRKVEQEFGSELMLERYWQQIQPLMTLT